MADDKAVETPAGASSTTLTVVGKTDPTLVDKAQVLGALAMIAVALAVVSYLAIQGSEQAQGAMIVIISNGVTYYLRGRVEKQA